MKSQKHCNKTDISFMKLALQLSWMAKGKTSPNPAVGAVVVKDGQVLSVGHTNSPGQFHAERMALSLLDTTQSAGATLYVTLEPCCFQGRTPPCTEIIIEKKIRKVFIAVLDPHPKVSGKGAELLRAAGIEVEIGLLESEARKINQDFFIWASENRPLITLKYAMTLDGKMAALSGDSKWITNSKARRISHILRYRSDAICVGVNTVIQDNPILNVRLPNRKKNLLRVILDPAGRTPKSSIVFEDSLPTLFVVKKKLVSNQFLKFAGSQKNKEIFLDENPSREIDLKKLSLFLAKRNITSLFVEGGARVLGSFLQQGLGDKIFIFLGDQVLGEGLFPFSGLKKNKMSEALTIQNIRYKPLENNLLIQGDIDFKSHKPY